MAVRKFSEAARRNYIRQIAAFAEFMGLLSRPGDRG